MVQFDRSVSCNNAGLDYKRDYKAVLVAKPYCTGRWKLCNLSVDPAETTDLANSKPKLLKNFISQWGKYANKVGLVAWK